MLSIEQCREVEGRNLVPSVGALAHYVSVTQEMLDSIAILDDLEDSLNRGVEGL